MEKLYYVLDEKTGKKFPTVRLLFETIMNDLVQGARFYDLNTLEQYTDAKDILYCFKK